MTAAPTAFARHVELIRRKLSTVTPAPREALANKSNAAAVLMPLFENDGDLHIVYIRRSDHVASHRGQVAFPGGRVDAVASFPPTRRLSPSFPRSRKFSTCR
jgi:hypothetical protein